MRGNVVTVTVLGLDEIEAAPTEDDGKDDTAKEAKRLEARLHCFKELVLIAALRGQDRNGAKGRKEGRF